MTEVPVLSQAFLRSASTQYRRVPAHFKPWSADYVALFVKVGQTSLPNKCPWTGTWTMAPGYTPLHTQCLLPGCCDYWNTGYVSKVLGAFGHCIHWACDMRYIPGEHKKLPPPACDLLIFQQCVRILHELLHNCWTVLWKYIRNTTIRECMHSVTGRHFRSRDKNGGHTIRCAVCFKELELMRIKVLHYGNRNFRSFYLLWPWLWPDDLRIRTWSVFPGDMPTGVVLGRQSPSSVQGPSIYGRR